MNLIGGFDIIMHTPTVILFVHAREEEHVQAIDKVLNRDNVA